MATLQSKVMDSELSTFSSAELSQLLREGLIAGILGAATIAVWFLIVDSLHGQPFYTPSILGTALFKDGVTTPDSLGIDLEVVFLFTWVHGLVFTAVGWRRGCWALRSAILSLVSESSYSLWCLSLALYPCVTYWQSPSCTRWPGRLLSSATS